MESENTLPFKAPAEAPQDTPAAAPEAKPAPKAPPPPVVFQNNATVEWFDGDQVVKTDVMPRSTAEILKYLSEVAKTDEKMMERKIRITVKAEPGQPLKEDGTEHIIQTEGLLKEVAPKLMMSSVTPPMAVAEFQRLSMYLSDHSSLKGIMVTAVFGDAEAGGFGFLSTTSTLTDADVITLVESAKNQIDLFREKIKQSHPNLVFPSESRLVLPNGRPV